jgi:outer membrane protein
VIRSSAAAGIALVTWAAGCTMPIPRVGGVPLAPPAPDHQWQPPRAAEANAPPPRAGIPKELVGRASSLTLPDIVSLALKNNPATRESWAQAQSYAYAYGSARGAYFPSIDATVPVTRSEQPSSANAASFGLAGARSTVAPSVSLSYTVLDFGSRSGSIASARETAYALSFTHNATLQSTVVNVEQAYYTYAGARAVLDATELSLHEAQASYRAAWKKDSLGMATKADVLQSRTAVAQAQLALDSAQAQVYTTRTNLAIAFGAPATLSFDVDACLDSINVVNVTQSVESLVDEGLNRRPDVQAAQAYVRAAQAEVRASRGALLPSLSLSAADGYTDATVTSLTGRNYSLSLGVSIPVFHGFSRSYDVARSRSLVQYQAAYADAVRQSVSSNVVIAYYQLQSATEMVHTSDDLFESASAALLVTRARYSAGLGSIIDLLTAQSSMAMARTQRARARAGWAYQLAELAYAAGALTDRGNIGILTAPAPRR